MTNAPVGSLAAEACFPCSGCRHLGNMAADCPVCSPLLTHFSLLFSPRHHFCALLASAHSWRLPTHGFCLLMASLLPLLGVSLGDFPFPNKDDLAGRSVTATFIRCQIQSCLSLKESGRTSTRARWIPL